ncbi:hypothetical protein AGR7C_Cc40084 [Agrobacterium deltaense Zutra 3/1]|uniref:Uncharacterized protein n=1 Tax=Agrobacterium deltaense Zutra 3/1 TaxID=1183427 RepID=A0A1S7QIL5_9HYPH|nr:hypothetical protein AGR7C_Cc40084 [Agrobacterium deltaense Zutra 3/1]
MSATSRRRTANPRPSPNESAAGSTRQRPVPIPKISFIGTIRQMPFEKGRLRTIPVARRPENPT